VSRAIEELLDISGNVPITLTALEQVTRKGHPRQPDVYAAWLMTAEALADLGIDAQPPILAYAGRDVRVGGKLTLLRR
jgi:hypothetical protein